MCQSKPLICTIRLAAFFSICLLLCLPLYVAATELSIEDKKLLEMNPEDILNSELTSPSVSKYWEEQGATSVNKRGDDPFNTPAAVYIISSEDIRRSGVTSVMEALRMAPGVQVARIDSNKWAISARGFNYEFSKRLRILVDGQALFKPVSASLFWDENIVPIEDIDRIEVIRGSGGVTWGTNAVNGVINIITKHAKDTQGNLVSALYGNEERGSVYARHGGKGSDNVFYRNYATRKAVDSMDGALTGRNLENDWRNSKAGFRVDGETPRSDKFFITGDIFSGDTDSFLNTSTASPFKPSRFRPDEKKSFGTYLNGKISRDTDDSLNSLQSYLQYDNFSIEGLEYEGITYDIDFQQTWSQNPRNEITWGVGYRIYSDETESSPDLVFTPNSTTENLFTAFLQDKYALVADKLYLTLGSKFEYLDKVGGEPEPTARLTYNVSENQTFWAAVSRTARYPTRGERGISKQVIGFSPIAPDALFFLGPKSSGNLKPDRSNSYEIGYRIKPSEGWLLDVTTFYNDYDNLKTSPPEIDSNGNLIYPLLGVSAGKAQSYGAELAATWQTTKDLRLEGSYSFHNLDMEIPSTHITLDNYITNPRHQFNLRSQYNIASNIFWDNSLYYVDEIHAINFVPLTLNAPDYLRLDTRVAWKPIHGLELSIAGQNLLDDKHQEFTDGWMIEPSTIGRSVYVKAAWEF